MQFGGTSQFGIFSQFGGDESRTEIYWRALRSIMPKGAITMAAGSHYQESLRADAHVLGGLMQGFLNHLAAELFPHLANETLPDWESILGVTSSDNAKVAGRRAAVVSKWRGPLGASLPALRKILAADLNPTTAFRDDHEDLLISWRYTDPVYGAFDVNAGTITELLSGLGGLMRLDLAGAAVGHWDGGAVGAPRAGMRLLTDGREGGDDVQVLTYCWPALANESAGGIVFWQDDDNAIFFVAANTGASDFARIDVLANGVLTLGTVTVATSSPPFYMRFGRVGAEWKGEIGDAVSTLAQVDVSPVVESFKPRYAGLFIRNAGANPGVNFDSLDWSIHYGKPENNVEIIEIPLAFVLTSFPDPKFTFFVHREPSDPGEYSIRNAQRSMDRFAQGHTVGAVGESDDFLTDDPFSLTDRDVLGS